MFNFETTEVRVIEDDGVLKFIAKDISDALGYRDPGEFLKLINEKYRGSSLTSTLGGY